MSSSVWSADVCSSYLASFWIGTLLLLILNIPMIGLWIRVLQIPYRFLYPAVICLICIGVYSVRASTFDIGVVLLFGLIGYVLRLLRFELADRKSTRLNSSH